MKMDHLDVVQISWWKKKKKIASVIISKINKGKDKKLYQVFIWKAKKFLTFYFFNEKNSLNKVKNLIKKSQEFLSTEFFNI